jgi:chromosome segregation ATPase
MKPCQSWALSCMIRFQTRPFLKVRYVSLLCVLLTKCMKPTLCLFSLYTTKANVTQEKLNRQGKTVSDFGKKADTLLRQRHYEDMLKFTMLRLRGSFADLILGTKNELQKSIDESFAMQKAEMEKSFSKRSADLEAQYTRQAFEAAQSFSLQLQEQTEERVFEIERLQNELTQAQQMANMVQAQFSLHRDSEIERLKNELTQAQQVANMVQAQFSLHQESTKVDIARLENELKQSERLKEQETDIAQAQLMQEREKHRQAIATFDAERENMVAKMSSTLETLRVQCSSVHNIEGKLREAEAKVREAEAKVHGTQLKLQETEERLKYAEHGCRQEKDAVEQQLSLVNETAYLLQNKLDSEIAKKTSLINVQKELEKRLEFERERGELLQQKFDHETKNTDALINVQKELEKHLEFERARGDLLQQELEIEIESKKEVVKSYHEANKQRHDEQSGVMNELSRVSDQLRRADEERSSLLSNLSMLQAKFEDKDMENTQLASELCSVSQGKEQLVSELERVSEQLRRANEDRSSLLANMNKLQAKFEENLKDNSQLANELCSVSEGKELLESELQRVSEQLRRAHEKESSLLANANRLQASFDEQIRVVHESNAKYSHLEEELQLSNERLNNTTELSSLLEARVAELEAKVQDQFLDLEAARLSEVEVEKLLADSLNEKQMFEAELTKALAEVRETKKRLSNAEIEYSQDRERFATALQGFEEEMTSAEAQMKRIVESNALLEAEKVAENAKLVDSQKEIANLKVIVHDLTESISKQANDKAKDYETLKKNMEDEMKNQEDQFVQLKNDCKAKVSKYEADIAVYEEAVKMLQKQVEILEELAESERKMSFKMAESDEPKREEMRQEFLARINAMKEEHDSALMAKDTDIAALQEKCQKREVYIKQMERICVKVREDLLKRKEHKKKLMGSIERSIQHIKGAKQSKESIYAGSTDIIEVVANEAVSFDSDVYNDFRTSILELIPDTDSGSDLHTLLKSFDDEDQCKLAPESDEMGGNGGQSHPNRNT